VVALLLLWHQGPPPFVLCLSLLIFVLLFTSQPRPRHSVSASHVPHTSGFILSLCVEHVASDRSDSASVVLPLPGAALLAAGVVRGHCTEALASSSGKPSATTGNTINTDDVSRGGQSRPHTLQLASSRYDQDSVSAGCVRAVTGGVFQSFRSRHSCRTRTQLLPCF
jgi:hypothetical protein